MVVCGLMKNLLDALAHSRSRLGQVWVRTPPETRRGVLTCGFCDDNFQFTLQDQAVAVYPSRNVLNSHWKFYSRALHDLFFSR